MVDGRVIERRFNIGEKLEDVRVERRPYQYLYADGEDDIFMNNETFEQIPISKDLVTGAAFMKEGDTVEVVSDSSNQYRSLCRNAYEDGSQDHIHRAGDLKAIRQQIHSSRLQSRPVLP